MNDMTKIILGGFVGITFMVLFQGGKKEVPNIPSEILVNSIASDITLSQYGPRMMYIRDTNACYMATVIAVNCVEKKREEIK